MRNQKGNEVDDGLVRTEELVVHSGNILEDSCGCWAGGL